MRRASQKLLDDWTVLGQSKRWEKNFHFFVGEKAKVGLTCVVERRRRGGRIVRGELERVARKSPQSLKTLWATTAGKRMGNGRIRWFEVTG